VGTKNLLQVGGVLKKYLNNLIYAFVLCAFTTFLMYKGITLVQDVQNQMLETQYLIQNLKAGINLQVEKELQIRRFRNYIVDTNPRIDPQLAFRIAELNYECSIKYPNIDPYLAISMQSVESHFNYRAKSNKGALGIFQIMPTTLRLICKSKGWEFSDALSENFLDMAVEAGYIFIDVLMQDYEGDDLLIAWNAGASWVGEETIPKETTDFIKKVNVAYYDILDTPLKEM